MYELKPWNFTWEVLKECTTQEELDYYERFYDIIRAD